MNLAAELTALIIAFGLLARFMLNLHRENVGLRAERDALVQDHASLMVHYRDTKTELSELREEHGSLLETACEMQIELDLWRAEEVEREKRGGAWVN